MQILVLLPTMKIILGWLLLSLILSKNFLCVQFGRFYHLRLGKLEQQHGHVDTSFVLAVLKLSRIMPRGGWENATCVKQKSKILLSSKEHTRHALWNLQDNKYSHPFPYLPCTGCHVIHVTWGIEYSRYAQCPVGISIEAFSTGVYWMPFLKYQCLICTHCPDWNLGPMPVPNGAPPYTLVYSEAVRGQSLKMGQVMAVMQCGFNLEYQIVRTINLH